MPVIRLKCVVLPEPLGPISATIAAALDDEIEILDRLDAAEAPGQLLGLDHRRSWRAGLRRLGAAQRADEAAAPDMGRLLLDASAAASAAIAGISPCRRNSIIATRMMPKMSSIDCTRSTLCSQPMPVNWPSMWIQPVKSCRNQDCSSCRMIAAEHHAIDAAHAAQHDHHQEHHRDREHEHLRRRGLQLGDVEGAGHAAEARADARRRAASSWCG